MEGLIGVFSGLSGQVEKHDDDFVDRLNSFYTVVVLVAFSVVVGMHQYVGTPINCFVPQHFAGSHSTYTNSYCWVRNTYYNPWDEEIPKEGEDRQTIYYYQWISFILLIQAVLFYFPSVIWHGFNQQSGVDADNILVAAQKFTTIDAEKARIKSLNIISNQIRRFLNTRKGVGSVRKAATWKESVSKRSVVGRRFGSYLVMLYIFVKVLYLLNVIFQLFMLNKLLRIDFSLYGIEVFSWMMKDHDWTTSPHVAFPRVTFCDFQVRRLGNLHRYTVQCVLPINLYTEKIYMFLWFWMVFVAILTAFSLISWLSRAIISSDRKSYIKNHLLMNKKYDRKSQTDKNKLSEFVKSYLRPDGIFLLRLIGHNTNTVAVSEIVCNLWDNYEPKDPELSDTPKSLPPSAAEPSAPPIDDVDGPVSEKEPLAP